MASLTSSLLPFWGCALPVCQVGDRAGLRLGPCSVTAPWTQDTLERSGWPPRVRRGPGHPNPTTCNRLACCHRQLPRVGQGGQKGSSRRTRWGGLGPFCLLLSTHWTDHPQVSAVGSSSSSPSSILAEWWGKRGEGDLGAELLGPSSGSLMMEDRSNMDSWASFRSPSSFLLFLSRSTRSFFSCSRELSSCKSHRFLLRTNALHQRVLGGSSHPEAQASRLASFTHIIHLLFQFTLDFAQGIDFVLFSLEVIQGLLVGLLEGFLLPG